MTKIQVAAEIISLSNIENPTEVADAFTIALLGIRLAELVLKDK